jgi:hypothetical protein
MKKIAYSFCLLLAFVLTTAIQAQTKVDPSEISSNVQELTDFHDIIYPMWHDAYPAKDYTALKGFVPKIKTYMDGVNKAKLPGILREKETAWKTQLKELNASADAYYAAASKNDNAGLLTAAENLHGNYEKLVRVLRPALKEIDDFHQSLYVIYHKLLPDSKFDEIAGMTPTLITKSDAIVKYPQDKLKTRLGDKVQQYDASAKKLNKSVLSLQEVLKGKDQAKKKEAVETMHKAYEELDGLFQ